MTDKTNQTVDGEDKETKQTADGEEAKQTTADSEVQVDRYQKYREAYIRERLRSENVKEGAELDAALSFVAERLDDDDSNFDDVMHQLEVRMRLNERRQYVDPPLGNSPSRRPEPITGDDVGKAVFDDLRKRGKLNWLTK